MLIVSIAGFGLFGQVQFQAASSLRGEVSALHSQVSELTTTIAGLQTENNHYQGVLSRVRVATGSLQASLTELNQLVALPVPARAAQATAAESTPEGN
jgi:hypothetical protein